MMEVSREETPIRPSVGWQYRLGGWGFELRGGDLTGVEVETSTNLVDWLLLSGPRQNASDWLPEVREEVRYFRIRGGR